MQIISVLHTLALSIIPRAREIAISPHAKRIVGERVSDGQAYTDVHTYMYMASTAGQPASTEQHT